MKNITRPKINDIVEQRNRSHSVPVNTVNGNRRYLPPIVQISSNKLSTTWKQNADNSILHSKSNELTNVRLNKLFCGNEICLM